MPVSRELNELLRKLYRLKRENGSLSSIRIEDFALKGSIYDAQKMANDLGMTTHQLRRFFDQIKKVKYKLKLGQIRDEDIRRELAMLRPMAQYAMARGHVKKHFVELIEHSVELIRTKEDFEVFEKLMTCLVAFSK